MKATQFIYILQSGQYHLKFLYPDKHDLLSNTVPLSFENKEYMDNYIHKNLHRFNALTKTHLEISNFDPPENKDISFAKWILYFHCYHVQKRYQSNDNWKEFLLNSSFSFEFQNRGYKNFFEKDRLAIFDYVEKYELHDWIFSIVASLHDIKVDHNDTYRRSNTLDPMILYSSSKHGETFSYKLNYLGNSNNIAKVDQYYSNYFIQDNKCTRRNKDSEIDMINWFNNNILSLKPQKELNYDLIKEFVNLCILNGISKKELLENELSKYYQQDNIYSHTIFEILLDAQWVDIKTQIDILNTIGYQSKISTYLLEQFNKESDVLSTDFTVDSSLFS